MPGPSAWTTAFNAVLPTVNKLSLCNLIRPGVTLYVLSTYFGAAARANHEFWKSRLQTPKLGIAIPISPNALWSSSWGRTKNVGGQLSILSGLNSDVIKTCSIKLCSTSKEDDCHITIKTILVGSLFFLHQGNLRLKKGGLHWYTSQCPRLLQRLFDERQRHWKETFHVQQGPPTHEHFIYNEIRASFQ